MANKKTTVLDALVSQLAASGQTRKATRILLLPIEARKQAPYVGLVSGREEVVVEDSTDVRYELEVNLILLKKGRDIESYLDEIKDILYATTLPATIGALQVKVVGQEEVALTDADAYSSTRILAIVTYVADKDGF